MRLVRAFATAAVLAAAASPVAADMLLTGIQHSDAFEVMGQKQEARDVKQTIWVGQGMLREESEGSGLIIRLDRKKAYLLDHARKTYSVLDLPIDLAKAITPEGRQALEQMAAMMKKDIQVTPVDESKKIRDWSARRFNVVMSNPMGMRIDTVTWATQDVKIDYAAYGEMAAQMQALVPGGAEIAKEMAKVVGLPVLTETSTVVMGATLKSREELLSAEQKPAPEGTYEIPAGYKEEPFNPFAKMGQP